MAIVPTLTLLFLTLFPLQSQNDKRPAQDWGRWPVGTEARFRVVMESEGARSYGTFTQRLAERTDAGYALVETFAVGSINETRTQQWSTFREAGSERLSAGPMSCDCVIWTGTGKKGNSNVRLFVWMPRGGGAAVRVRTTVDGAIESEGTSVGVEEPLSASGRSFQVVRVEGALGEGERRQVFTTWLSRDVPGGVVRTFLKGSHNSVTFELAELRRDSK